MTPEIELLEHRYPSVSLAYEFAVSAYELAQKRLDVVENRLQLLLAFAPTATIAIIAAAANRGVSFRSLWFYAALSVGIFAISFGTYVRLAGFLIVVDPNTLYQQWLEFSEWEFKKNFIYFSARHFEKNCQLISFKSRWTAYLAITFLLEALFLLLWISRRGP